MSRRGLALLVALALGVTLAACGDDDEREGAAATNATGTQGTQEEQARQPTGPAVATVDVSETEYKLDPANPKVSKAGVIEFKASNDGQTTHALEVEGPDGEARTDPIQPGESATIKVDLKKGTYVWYCPIDGHREKGMEGKVSVAGGGPVREDEDESGDDDSGGDGSDTGADDDSGAAGGGPSGY